MEIIARFFSIVYTWNDETLVFPRLPTWPIDEDGCLLGILIFLRRWWFVRRLLFLLVWCFGVEVCRFSRDENKRVFEYSLAFVYRGEEYPQKFCPRARKVTWSIADRTTDCCHTCGNGKVSIKNDSRRRAEAGRQHRYILSVCGGHDGERTGTCKVFRGWVGWPSTAQHYYQFLILTVSPPAWPLPATRYMICCYDINIMHECTGTKSGKPHALCQAVQER